MINEFLTNNCWIDPQINYLLFLQNIRMQYGGEQLFMGLTKFGEFFIPAFVMSIVYWCIDFKSGLYLICLNVLNLLMAQIMKLGACVYRPWVICDKIHPVETAMKTASGYSFPSGHTAIASVWAGIAFLLRKKTLLSASFLILVLLIAFSRNYVGVHTPQDVVVAILVMAILILPVFYLINWCEKDRKNYIRALFFIDLAIFAAAMFVLFKNYPMDYVDGKLLVNPNRAIYGAITNAGWIAGLINGAFLCAGFYPFDTKNISLRTRIIRAAVGIILFTPLYLLMEKYCLHASRVLYLAFIMSFVMGFFITGVYPLTFKFLNNFENLIDKIYKK